MDKNEKQTIYERAEVSEQVVYQVRDLLKKTPADVLGHLDVAGICCRAGTVAIVKLDLEEVQGSKVRKR